jgi:hypothetical protein
MRNDQLLTRLLALSRHHSLDAGADIVVKAAAILALLLLLAGYRLLPTLPVYGHDEMHYYPSFYFKLLEDGRWLNYLLHDLLRSVPLPLWSMVYLSLAWVLFYRVARLYAFNAAYAALVASTIVLSYPFVEIALWPGTVVPVLLLGLLALWLQGRGFPYQAIYLVSGILMFGSMQTLYFVLPLLFVPTFPDNSQPPRARWQLLLSHMCWWVGGSVAGVLCMSLMLHLLATPELSGPVNLVGPAPMSNAEFTRALGRVLHRPTVLPVPGLAIRTLFGDMGNEALLQGAYVDARRLRETGFLWCHRTVEEAVRFELGLKR